MPKLTKRKTGDAFAFTTSTAMGKRIRHEAKFKGLSVSEFIRQVVGKAVSPNVPVEGSSFAVDPLQFVKKCPPMKIDETHRVFVITGSSSTGKTRYIP